MMEDDFDFGPCCSCGCETSEANPVRNIMMLSKKAPVPGTGWGCVVCGLPFDGASAIICDSCLDGGLEKAPIKWVIKGLAAKKERAPIESCTEPFEHDMRLHPEENISVEWEED